MAESEGKTRMNPHDGIGRPRKDEKQIITDFIKIGITKPEDEKSRKLAHVRGLNQAQLVRQVFREWMAKQ